MEALGQRELLDAKEQLANRVFTQFRMGTVCFLTVGRNLEAAFCEFDGHSVFPIKAGDKRFSFFTGRSKFRFTQGRNNIVGRTALDTDKLYLAILREVRRIVGIDDSFSPLMRGYSASGVNPQTGTSPPFSR